LDRPANKVNAEPVIDSAAMNASVLQLLLAPGWLAAKSAKYSRVPRLHRLQTHLRHSKFVGLREDKKAKDVGWE
jgi:hypothetical protein